MYIEKNKSDKLLSELKRGLSNSIIEKIDFLSPLLYVDDWTLIVKAHAAIENIITDLILARINEPKLKGVIERLPLSDEEIGKLIIVKEYNLLSENERSFIKKFSALRNHIIHKYENLNFKFSEYLNSLDSNQYKSWAKNITQFAKDNESRRTWIELLKKAPETVLWVSVFMLLTKTVAKGVEFESESKLNKLALETAQNLLKTVFDGIQ